MQVSEANSKVSVVYDFESSQDAVLSQVIHTMTVLGKGAPRVDRLLGRVAGPIKKKAVPFRGCFAEVVVTSLPGRVSVFVSVVCEQDKEVNRHYSLTALRQISTWLLASKNGLSPKF